MDKINQNMLYPRCGGYFCVQLYNISICMFQNMERKLQKCLYRGEFYWFGAIWNTNLNLLPVRPIKFFSDSIEKANGKKETGNRFC